MNTFNKKEVTVAILVILVTILSYSTGVYSAQLAVDKDSNAKEDYKTYLIYEGGYYKSALYYKNPGSSKWNKMSTSSNYLDVVKCQPALRALNSAGKWNGHLKEDGACGSTDEPSFFAVGNRINYESIRSGENK
jgi:hypothetical protein